MRTGGRVRRLLRRVARSPVVVWPLALAAGTGAAGQVLAAREAERRWGQPLPVVVTARAVAPGRRLRASDLRLAHRPAPLVPPGSIRRLDAATGRVVATALQAGEPVLRIRLAHRTLTATQVLIGRGRRAVTLAADTGTPALAPGDVVDLVAARGPADGPGPEGVVAAGAVVLRADDRRITVSVPTRAVPAVARAVVSGPVLVVLRGA